jgi:hypothetical protein
LRVCRTPGRSGSDHAAGDTPNENSPKLLCRAPNIRGVSVPGNVNVIADLRTHMAVGGSKVPGPGSDDYLLRRSPAGVPYTHAPIDSPGCTDTWPGAARLVAPWLGLGSRMGGWHFRRRPCRCSRWCGSGLLSLGILLPPGIPMPLDTRAGLATILALMDAIATRINERGSRFQSSAPEHETRRAGRTGRASLDAYCSIAPWARFLTLR